MADAVRGGRSVNELAAARFPQTDGSAEAARDPRECRAGTSMCGIFRIGQTMPSGRSACAQSEQIEEIPARIAAAPFAFVGIVEIAIRGVTDELVVEAQRVVADHAGVRHREFLDDAPEQFGFAHAFAQRVLRRDAGDQGGFGRWQKVVGRLAVHDQRLADRIQVVIGAQAGELRDARAARISAEGFQVVPVEGSAHWGLA